MTAKNARVTARPPTSGFRHHRREPGISALLRLSSAAATLYHKAAPGRQASCLFHRLQRGVLTGRMPVLPKGHISKPNTKSHLDIVEFMINNVDVVLIYVMEKMHMAALIGNCPSCGGRLRVQRLWCDKCEIAVEGNLTMGTLA
ncbi:MAG: DUF2089-like zinc ribbon domain-containing protein, partial [Bacteroidota bacterium]